MYALVDPVDDPDVRHPRLVVPARDRRQDQRLVEVVHRPATSRSTTTDAVLSSGSGGDNLWHFFVNSLEITIPRVILSVGHRLARRLRLLVDEVPRARLAVRRRRGDADGAAPDGADPDARLPGQRQGLRRPPAPARQARPHQRHLRGVVRPRLFRHAVLHLHHEELRVGAAEGHHRSRPRRRRQPLHHRSGG